MNKSIAILYAVILGGLFSACSSSYKIRKTQAELNSILKGSPIFNNHFTGFILYDPVSKTTLADYNGTKNFTPASNTKILTLYTALSILPDSLPSFKYQLAGDQLIMKGMADPTLLNPLWPDHPGFKRIQEAKQLTLVLNLMQDKALGEGWAWDDYTESYQAEKSDLPLYGNLVRFNYPKSGSKFEVYPPYFQHRWTDLSIVKGESKYNRSLNDNEFGLAKPDSNGTWYLPYKTDPHTIRRLLEDTLKHKVLLSWAENLDHLIKWKTAYGVQVDSVYAHMMKVSDNFIAEQLLLMCSSYLFDTLNTAKIIDYAKKNVFNSMLDSNQWVDGSGLSRYNLISPRSIVYVLDQIRNKMSWEKIQSTFPAGGVSGTIKNYYPGNGKPYVFAKTGSLSNNHALSGYIQTNSGKVLIFSFMHSNYTGSAAPIRSEMRKTLEFIRDSF